MNDEIELPKVAVILASIGRPDCLAVVLDKLNAQSYPPCQIILSVIADSDLPEINPGLNNVVVVKGPQGLPAQRNSGLEKLQEMADVVAFFDDDYVPSRFCVEGIAQFYANNHQVVGANGMLLADGIKSGGIDLHKAELTLEHYDANPRTDAGIVKSLHGLYGCNMTYRCSALKGVKFDERLKLYGWQEDIDFAVQVGRKGRIVQTHSFAGIHLGVKGARTSGIKLGYSQIINPIYLNKKGTMRAGFALSLIIRNVLANHLRAFWPEPWIDRMGRVKGNWIGMMDYLRGRITPERIEKF